MALPGLVAARNLADVADRERAWDNLGQEFAATFDTFPLALALGSPLEGGFFAGYISHTADGNPTHALIVAPRATGATGTGYTLTTLLANKTTANTTAGTTSEFDGVANTAAMVAAGIANHPSANFCVGLSIGGFNDWYLPSRLELDIAYFNLKPTTVSNSTSWGINVYAVPARATNFTADNPLQTTVGAFNTSAERFSTTAGVGHSSSTELFSTNAAAVDFATGARLNFSKTSTIAVRAFRRIAL